MSEQNWGCLDKMSEVNFSPAESLHIHGLIVYIRSLPHSRFNCHLVFSVKSDCMHVMGAQPSLLFCSLLLCKYHSKCIESSDWSR